VVKFLPNDSKGWLDFHPWILKRVVGFSPFSPLELVNGESIFTLDSKYISKRVGFTLGSKKIITWFFQPSLEEIIRFDPQVLKRRSQ
jgi:hypothetical protein